MNDITLTEAILWFVGCLFVFFIGRLLVLWYYKIDERLAQMHETNRLLRKLAGEEEVKSNYLTEVKPKEDKTPIT